MFEEIKQLLIESANVEEKIVTPKARLKEDLKFDSLYAVEMVLELESNYHIQIQYDELRALTTVSDVVELVERKRREQL